MTKILKESGETRTAAAIEKYKEKYRCRDYYMTMDSLGFSVGIEYMLQSVINVDTDKVVGWVPTLKFHDKNPVTGKFEWLSLPNTNH